MPHRLFYISFLLVLNCLSERSCVIADEISFEKQIRPILNRHCAECHGPEVQKSDLRLDARHTALRGGSSGPAIVAGDSDNSELLRRITSQDPDDRMPPEGDRLPSSDVELLKRWIDAGAIWPESEYDRNAAVDPRLQHWSFQPLKPVAIPEVAEDRLSVGFVQNEIDRFILQRLQQSGLQPNERADRRTLIRRATFDLIGLPADPHRIDEFFSDDQPDAWSKRVDELLASPRYGERWAQHWLDVVRYADTHGFEVNTPRDNAWRYRDYVINALNENKPYDQFLREQLAGDIYAADAATGFLVASAVLLPGQIGADDESKRLARQDALDEIIAGTSSAMLGLTIACARCHDHKFDPISQHDYYSLQAYFSGVEYGDRPIQDEETRRNRDRLKDLEPSLAKLEAQVRAFEPRTFQGRTLILDESDQSVVTRLKKENGPGVNLPGAQRGYRDDPGAPDRIGNLSAGQYTWWDNVPGEDVMTWDPQVAGTFRLWLSWGAHGSGVHTRDARYILDQDGNLATREDQRELAQIDQYFLAGISEGDTEKVPLWSGLRMAGLIELTEDSRIILRGGDTGTGITADVIVLQEDFGAGETPWPLLREAVTARQNVERFPIVRAKYVRFTTWETIDSDQHEPCIDELEVYGPADAQRNLALAQLGTKPSSSGNLSETGIHQLKHINDGQYGNSHSWISNKLGRGWVQLEFAETEEIDRVVWSRDRDGKFHDRLPVRYQISASEDGQNWQSICSDQDRVPMGSAFDPVLAILRDASPDARVNVTELVQSLEQLRAEKSRLETPRMAFAGVFREPDRTFLLRRGDPEQRMNETFPAVPTVFRRIAENLNSSAVTTSTTNSEQQRRVALAEWISSPGNPLTARVMVNRIWQGHFGIGLVETSNDFGVNGTQPTHPELLDWLAAEFIRSGWSVKHMHRLIMNSGTYQQSSRIQPQSAELDRNNRLLSRYSSRRLESEAIRDCLLHISGELNLAMGGPGYSFFNSRGGLDGFVPRQEFTANEMRRMIYSHKVRMEQVPVFGAFDCPDAGQSLPRRGQSTTAIQALNLFNSPFVMDRAAKFSQQISSATELDITQKIYLTFRRTLGRVPSETELQAANSVVQTHGLEILCRVLMNSSEFLFIP
jgi:hypothetical protein